MIDKLNEIADNPPSEFGVHNGNETVLHEYGLDNFIQMQHDGNAHVQDDDIKDNLYANLPTGILI